MKFDYEFTERIKFYRRSIALVEVTFLTPLVFGVLFCVLIIVVSIAQGRCWLYEVVSYYNRTACRWGLFGIFLLVLLITAWKLATTVRRDRKELYEAFNYDESKYNSFKRALEGACVGLGLEILPLVVLDIPTVSSIAFKQGKRPAVGVTAEALEADLSSQEKEAMMAHEAAHILLGDYFMASRSARFRYAARTLTTALALLTILAILAINPGVILYILPFILTVIAVAASNRIKNKTSIVYRHNDLLADSVVVKVTMNPEALRETIGTLWSLSRMSFEALPSGAQYPGYMFIARPSISTSVRSYTAGYRSRRMSGTGGSSSMRSQMEVAVANGSQVELEKEADFAYATVKYRIENMKAIEKGHWSILEEPLRRQRFKGAISLVAMMAVLLAFTILIVFPWKGKDTVWDFATTNIVAKMVTDSQLETINLTESIRLSLDEDLNSLLYFLSAKLASGVTVFEQGEQIEIQTDTAFLKSQSGVNIENADRSKNTLKGIKVYAPSRKYKEYADLRMQLLDLSIHYNWVVGQLADEVHGMAVAGVLDPAALSARLNQFQSEISQLESRAEELRFKIGSIGRELKI